MGRRLLVVLSSMLVFAALAASPALACGGLIGPRGAVNLLRTTTFAGYHQGVEHYVTAFKFAGGGGKFGSLIPLPGVPTKVERGGDWTLKRLEREVAPATLPGSVAFASAADGTQRKAAVILEVKIDALDITVLKGGGREVGEWAEQNGFELSPDAPEVLDFYAKRSPIFMAARFDAAAAKKRGQQVGDGTPVHLTIPTPNPWVPLRILGLGKEAIELVEADVFLLTDRAPSVLPAPEGFATRDVPGVRGMRLERSERASASLLKDLNEDKGMSWLPRKGMWLSYFRIDTPAALMRNDLAIDASGGAQPSWIAAGLPRAVGVPVPPITRPIERVTIVAPPAPPQQPLARAVPADPTVALLGMLALGLAAGSCVTAIARRRRAISG